MSKINGEPPKSKDPYIYSGYSQPS